MTGATAMGPTMARRRGRDRRRQGSPRAGSGGSGGSRSSGGSSWTGRTGGVGGGDGSRTGSTGGSSAGGKRYGDRTAPRPVPAGSPGGSARGPSRTSRTTPSGRPQRQGSRDEREELPAVPDIPQPSAGVSFARGLGAVGGSPVLLATVLVVVVLLWLVFTSYGGGTGTPPRAMVWLVALPPIHSLLDLQLLAFGGVSAGFLLLYAVGLLLFRTLLAGYLITDLARTFGSDRQGRGPRTALTSLRSSLSALRTVFALELAYVVFSLLVAILFQLFLGPQFGLLALFAWLFGGVFFLGQTEVVAVVERVSPRQAARLAFRSARVPGRGHVLLAGGYLLFTMAVSLIDPSGTVTKATPSIAVWIYVLFVSVLHVAMLGALTYRWVVQGEAVKEWDATIPPRAARARRPGLSLLGGRR